MNVIQPHNPRSGNPIMPQHQLTVKKDTKVFKAGETVSCYIQKFKSAFDTDNRFGVYPTPWKDVRYEVFEEADLHDTFDEKL